MVDRVFHPKTFTEVFCTHDQAIMPHRAGRVLAQCGNLVEVELHCRKCGNKVVYGTDTLPLGYRVFQVRVVGEDNPSLPAEFRPHLLPSLEEEFMVVATSTQEAHETAEWVTTLPFKGHSVRWYVDGGFHPDERF